MPPLSDLFAWTGRTLRRGVPRGSRGVSQTSPLVDANGAAQMLDVPASWLLAQARAGHIPHHRLGHYVRFDLDELTAWLEENQAGS